MSKGKVDSKEKASGKTISRLSSLLEKHKKLADEVVEYFNSQDLDIKKEAEVSSKVLEDFNKKWSIEIMYLLFIKKEMGFEEIRKLLNGISSRTLSNRLKSLEDGKFVRRKVITDRPPRVKYSLTERGETLAAFSAPTIYFLRKEQDLL